MNLFGWMLFAEVFGRQPKHKSATTIPYREPYLKILENGNVLMEKHKPLNVQNIKPGMIWEFN